MLIDQIKTYAGAALIIVLMTLLGTTKIQLDSVTKEYKTYKDSINDQLQKAKIEKARIEAEQAAKEKSANEAYQRDLDRLNRILNGLQKPKAVPGNEALPVAGDSPGSVSRKAEDTAGITQTSQVEACVKRSPFFSEAMRDTLQCSRLIEFVSK